MNHLCDTNVFLALVIGQHAKHAVAKAWFSALPGKDQIAFCRATQNSFLRLLTQKIATHFTPLTNREAWDIYDRLYQDDALFFAEEPDNLESSWRSLSQLNTPSPKTWMDTYLASFAIASKFRMVSLDHDFQKFQTDGLDLLLLDR